MRKVVVASADACRETAERGGRRAEALMVTATLRPGAEYRPRDIATLVQRMREWAARRGVRVGYQWVIELQRRGAPHYHVLLWVPRGFRFLKPDDAGWWPHGSTRIERARRAVGYLVKYATKGQGAGSTGNLPYGARLFGVGGLEEAEKLHTHRAGLPSWLAACTEGRCKRLPLARWVDLATGEVVGPSPWQLITGYEGGRPFVVVVKRAADTS